MLRRGLLFALCGLPGYLGVFLSLFGLALLAASCLWLTHPAQVFFYALLLLGAGLCLLVLTGIGLHRDRILVRSGVCVEGQITRRSRSLLRYAFGATSLDGVRRAWVLHYRYEVDGIVYAGRSRYLWKRTAAMEQDSFPVYYDPRHPQRSALDFPIF